MENRKINILGTEYTICEKTEEQDCRLKKCDGYCDKTSKEIVVLKISADNCDLHNPKWYTDKVLRHEIVHAFLFESGMHEYTNWDTKESCHNEQLVDWFAIQSPKIFKVYLELGLIDTPIPSIPPLQTGSFVNVGAAEALKNVSEGIRKTVEVAKQAGLLNE